MPVTTGEKCIVTTRNGSSFHATFVDVYTGPNAFINHSQTAEDFREVPTTPEAYVAKLRSTTRLLVGKKQLMISTKNIIKMESLHDLLAELNVPIDCLRRVANYV